jgi:hypothetical protein
MVLVNRSASLGAIKDIDLVPLLLLDLGGG